VEFSSFSELLFPFEEEVGYIALLLVSFFGSLIPFVPIPSFVLVATMAVGDQFNIHALVIVSALAATGAKLIVFYVSYGGRRIFNESTRERMRPFERLVKRYGAAAAFIAAATPIPDDLVYIPLGLAKYNPKRFFIATLTGKFVLYYIIVLIAHFVGISILDPLLQDVDDPNTVYIGFGIFIAIMILMVVVMLKLDWRKVLGKTAPWTLEDDEDDDKN